MWARESLATLLMGHSPGTEHHCAMTLTTANGFFYCPPLRVDETEALRGQGQGEVTCKVHRTG